MAVRIDIFWTIKSKAGKGANMPMTHDLVVFRFPHLVPLQPTSHEPTKAFWIKNKEKIDLKQDLPGN